MLFLRFVFFVLLVLFASCTGQKSKNEIENGVVELQVEEIKFPPQTVLQLKSYYLSSSIHTDSVDFLVGYNYRLHSLDYMNLKSKEVTQTMLFGEGPNAITSLTGLYAVSLDSIWVSDESEHVFLLDRAGQIKEKVNLREHLQDTEQLLINTNHAMFTSHLYYNEIRQSLMFLVKNLPSLTFTVKELSMNDRTVLDYKLEASKVVPDISTGYDFVNAPNVNFTSEEIVYNYPFESSIYTLNIKTNERKYIAAQSQYTANVIERIAPRLDYSAIEKLRIQNPHFFDVMYLSDLKKYVRLHLGGVDWDEKKDIGELMNDRTLYLMFFDDEMRLLGETELVAHRYDYFTGWSALPNGVAFYVDNMLDEKNDTENLIIDIVSFPK